MTTVLITSTALASLKAFAAAAEQTGVADATELHKLADTIVRERRVLETAAYLATRPLTQTEKRKVANIAKGRSVEQGAAIRRLAEDWIRGDIKQVLDILSTVRLTAHEQDAMNRVRVKASSPFPPNDMSAQLADLMKIAASHEIRIPTLKPERIKRPTREGDVFRNSAFI